ncbi:MAG: methylmalonyl-CoA mutase [Chloroflexi bacterium]|jgi:methylmalonyl-CoA mutase C-terminal domain/subunit|nr:methylmalonyl-CoA mutase [Chloroflexota bacterium]MCH2304071.1 cobalamin B12-binding domain-containing protein [SAR202 cluster bacterium]|tara:strand:+ start:502 stop:891 length:390 start_codon:yes stop_codon:yes gene_type:complete
MIKVLIAKSGLDGHDRGAKIIVRALRDAGMEVTYTGIRQTPEMIVDTAMELNVNVIGLSTLSGAHLTLFPQIVEGIKKNKLDKIIILAGGIIPNEDKKELEKLGIKGIFGPGTPTNEIIKFIETQVNSS